MPLVIFFIARKLIRYLNKEILRLIIKQWDTSEQFHFEHFGIFYILNSK